MKADCWLVKRLKRIDLPSPLGIHQALLKGPAETLVDLHTSPTAPSPPSGNLLDFAGADKRKSHSNIMLVKMYLVVIVYVSLRLWCMNVWKALEIQKYSSLIYRKLLSIFPGSLIIVFNLLSRCPVGGRHSLWIYESIQTLSEEGDNLI